MSFIVIFSALVVAIPADFQGAGETVDLIAPINPALVSDFSEIAEYQPSDFPYGIYNYDLGGRTWLATHGLGYLELAAKVFVFGLWFGETDIVRFVNQTGYDRGTALSFAEIAADATDELAIYTLYYDDTGGAVGSLILAWNITESETVQEAWDNDGLYMVHGIGFDSGAVLDIGQLLVALLFLQLPDVPVLVNVLIVVPIWAAIIYVAWFIVKEMTPFV